MRSEAGEPRVYSIRDDALEFEAFIAVDSPDGWMSFGGLRVSPSVDAETVRGLAMAMRRKYALHGLQIGGAKGGIRCSSARAHRPEVIRAFARWAAPLLRESVILGKDLGASDELLDACYAALGVPQLHLARLRVSPDCPTRVRDLAGYVRHMTGLGVAWTADEALRLSGGALKGARVIVQGCGRVGLGAAIRLEQLGARIIGINDIAQAIYNADGLPLASLTAAVDADGTIDVDACDFPHRRLARDELLGLDADVLVPAADSRVIDAALAATIRAPIVVEGANAPLQPDAERHLVQSGCALFPDIIASSSSAALVGHQLLSAGAAEPTATWQQIERCIREGTRALARRRATGESPRGALRSLTDGATKVA